MHRTRVWLTLAACFLAGATLLWAQSRKPGLWELTTTMTWQKSPFPAGMNMPAGGANSPFGGGPHTVPVCLTQQQIDDNHAITPTMKGCQITNVAKKPNGMTADLECTGLMSGKGTLESAWSDSEHATGKVHFVGSMLMGPQSTPIEWTTVANSVYKGPDCGSVKP
ncbi:MAG TPA: DUF3617 family protein, partial [Candidatus Methylomirabilis sp.]|nr:DUF3617 family protein [Candidatus Methylomirabilis sp.]